MILRRSPRNRASLRSQLNSPVIFLSQIHGNIVIDADEWYPVSKQTQLSSKPWRVCAIQTADCLPVLFAANQPVLAGLALRAPAWFEPGGVLQNTVRATRARGRKETDAWLELGDWSGKSWKLRTEEVKLAFEKALGDVGGCLLSMAGGSTSLASRLSHRQAEHFAGG